MRQTGVAKTGIGGRSQKVFEETLSLDEGGGMIGKR